MNGPVNDYADYAFETIRIKDGRCPLLPLHLHRIRLSLQALSLPYPQKLLLSNIHRRIKSHSGDQGVMRVAIHRNYSDPSSGSGNLQNTNCPKTTLQIITSPLHKNNITMLTKSKYATTVNDIFSNFKHGNRLKYTHAANVTPHSKKSEILLCDVRDTIVDCLHHRVFWIKNNRIFTPSLLTGSLWSVSAMVIEKKATALHIATHYDVAQVNSLHTADALFLANAVQGVLPINQFYGTRYEKHPIISSLRKKFHEKIYD